MCCSANTAFYKYLFNDNDWSRSDLSSAVGATFDVQHQIVKSFRDGRRWRAEVLERRLVITYTLSSDTPLYGNDDLTYLDATRNFSTASKLTEAKKSNKSATVMCPCGKCQLMSHIVNSWQDQKPSWRIDCSDYTRLIMLPVNSWRHTAHKCTSQQQLEYLAVYGRASMAAFCQLSTHIVPPRSNVQEAWLNTHGQKFDPESLYEPIKFATLQPYLVNKY